MTPNTPPPPLSLVLYSPRIPQNLGAVGRLCAATRVPLHVVRPIPFPLTDKSLRRAGMDYWDKVALSVHDDFAACRAALPTGGRRWLLTTKADRVYTQAEFRPGDALVFGNEPEGAPDWLHEELAGHRLAVPMDRRAARSLNLAMTCGIVVYEALRQMGAMPE